MSPPSRVRVIGPLAPFADGFSAHLLGRGYIFQSAERQVRLAATLSRWLAREELGATELTTEVVERFVGARQAEGKRYMRSRLALVPLLDYLLGIGVAPAPPPLVAATAVERLLEEYERYLLRERALAARTVRGYVAIARVFLSDWSAEHGSDLELLSAGDVSRFVLKACRRHREAPPKSVTGIRSVSTALRALLRFLFLEARTPTDLASVVPVVARWRLSSLPRALEPAHVARLLESCDKTTAVGRRDFAILTVLSRLGLRRAEVAKLRLDDVDWRAGEIVVSGKGAREDRLPLPQDVGEAIVAYLSRGRPLCPCRQLFLRVRAPHGGLKPAGIGSVVSHACERAGLPPVGTHRLRHGVATEMLARGAPLTEIGQVLRHKHPETTAIYAKVDRASLSRLARPWPGGRS
jgi:integrase/recombinase XerD